MSEEHLPATYSWLAESASLRAQIDSLSAPTPEGNEAYWRANWKSPSRADFAIVDERGAHLGNCGLASIDLMRQKAELWIYLGESYGSGAGSQAVDRLLAHGFEQLGLHRIYLRVVSDNPRALPFYERLGFVVEGRFRADTRHGDTWVDSIWLAILAEEYAARRAGV